MSILRYRLLERGHHSFLQISWIDSEALSSLTIHYDHPIECKLSKIVDGRIILDEFDSLNHPFFSIINLGVIEYLLPHS